MGGHEGHVYLEPRLTRPCTLPDTSSDPHKSPPLAAAMTKKGKGKAPADDGAGIRSTLGVPGGIGMSSSTPTSTNGPKDLLPADVPVSTTKQHAEKGAVTLQDEDTTTEELPDVVVNKWSLHELKTACDDAVQQYLSKPSLFQASHMHTDVRLVLGWTSSIIALSGALYAYKVNDFQASRQYVLASVIIYVVLSTVMAVYSRYVEQDTIFQGKRKVFAGRIETQQLHVRTACASPYKPIYQVTMSYHHSSNGGKTLIAQSEETFEIPFNEVFDVNGKLHRHGLERRIKEPLDKALAG